MHKMRSVILLIDDDVVIDFLHQKLLTKAGVKEPIITLFNGKVAIDELLKLNNSLHENDTVLALLDINMPVLDGWGFLAELEVIYSSLKFKLDLFVVSSSNNYDDITKSKSNPFVTDYLSKPLTVEIIQKHFL
jgi:response regulator of citrate/malate metabolism